MRARRRPAVGLPAGARFAGAAAVLKAANETVPGDAASGIGAFAAVPSPRSPDSPAPAAPDSAALIVRSPDRPAGARFVVPGRHATREAPARRGWPFPSVRPHGGRIRPPDPPPAPAVLPGLGARGAGRLGRVAPA
ncbi:hypothetical protein [Pseudonocardia thermophila]|uniref:hypothetical protein n=1 Tax=Pseudonocardia thermophila TaxID=1848 RepID=UPI00248DB7B0|nr:hypothetical protein [Pseudonocardia thermophila]